MDPSLEYGGGGFGLSSVSLRMLMLLAGWLVGWC